MTFRQRIKYGAAVVLATAATGAMAAEGDNAIDQLFAAAGLSTTSASVIALGVVVIGICMAYKGIDLVKRAVRKA